MDKHLYFSIIPEALIASQLAPEQFGQYYATGHAYRSRGQALFFEVDPAFRHDFFALDAALEQCHAHEDGTPKNSVYVAAYRVLEHLPTSALGTLYLTTPYGSTMGLTRSDAEPPTGGGLHVYKELAPVNTLVASSQDPRAFAAGITTRPTKFLSFPGLCFVELEIGELASDPLHGRAEDLPYENVHHLREALLEVSRPGKTTKIAERTRSPEFPYRLVKQGSGFYYVNGGDFAFYPMPTHDELRDRHALWWRSANQ